MELNRRDFLKAMAAIAVAGATPAIGATLTPNKYDQTFAMYDVCLAVRNDEKALGQAFNTMVNFMLDNFPAPDTSRETFLSVRKALKSNYLSKDMITLEMVESTFPIWVMRLALFQDRIYVGSYDIERFGEFDRKYKYLINPASESRPLTDDQAYAAYLSYLQ